MTIGVTNRTAFTNAVVTPAQIRSLIVYYDTTDGESVTPRLVRFWIRPGATIPFRTIPPLRNGPAAAGDWPFDAGGPDLFPVRCFAVGRAGDI